MAEWITVKEAGELLSISSRQVINRVHRGKLRAKKDGRIWLIHSSLSEEVEVTGETSEEVSEEAGEVYRKLEEMVDYLKAQIEEKDKQISELHQMLMMSEGNQRQLLEDKRPWWQRWRRKSEPDVPGG